ncbi:MAG: hypothetical protein ACPGWS_08320, partial [Solirubrobacterales bacterium]
DTPVIETMRGWVVCPNYDLAKEHEYFYQDLVERGPDMKWGYEVRRGKKNANQGDMEIVLYWGKNQRGEDVESVIQVRTSANEKSLQSEELDWVILSEAAELDESVWTKYLATRATRSIFPTTPKVGAGWILDMIESAETNPSLGVGSFNFSVRANPKYKCDRFWAAHQKAELQVLNQILTIPEDDSLPPSAANGHDCFDSGTVCEAAKDDGFAEQFLGRWTLKEGRVVPLREKVGAQGQPSHVIHADLPWFRHADLHISVDYGFSDGTCLGFWLVGPKQVVLRRSIYETGLVPDDIVKLAMQEKHWFEQTYREDILKRVIGDPKKPEVAELFRRRGLKVWDVNKSAQVDRQAGHMEFMNILQTDPATGEPGMLIHADNHEVIGEWRKLRRNKGVRSELSPTAFIGADHAYDMTRYFVMTRPIRTQAKAEGVQSLRGTDFEKTRKRILLGKRPQRRTVSMNNVRSSHAWAGGAH